MAPPRMAVQKQDDQLELTYSNYVRTQDVTLKTCRRRWMIGRSGKRGSGISVLAVRHDDDDDIICWTPTQILWSHLQPAAYAKCMITLLFNMPPTHFRRENLCLVYFRYQEQFLLFLLPTFNNSSSINTSKWSSTQYQTNARISHFRILLVHKFIQCSEFLQLFFLLIEKKNPNVCFDSFTLGFINSSWDI